MKLAQISNLSQRGAQLAAVILENEPVLQAFEFKQDPSYYNVIPDLATYTGGAARAENAALSKDSQKPNPAGRSLALYGREIGIDDVRRLDANVGVSPAGLRMFADRQLKKLAKKLSSEVVVDMFQGTDSSNKMLGLAEFIKDASSGGQTARLGFSASDLAAMNAQASLKLDTTANQDAFIELLEKKMAEVPGANMIAVNTNLKARLSTIARRLGALGQSINTFGQQVQTFNGVPFVAVSTTALPQTESDGTNNDNCSLFVLRTAEDLGQSFSTNSGFYFSDFEEVQAKPEGIARLQFFLNLTVDADNAVRRVSRIRL